MSELDKIKECLDFFCRRCNEQGFYSPPLQPIVKEAYEAIAALRSEPVATVRRKEDDSLEFTPLCDFYVVNGMKLYAAPSRKTAKVVPVHSKSQYRRVAAQGGNPVLSRETEQRESSGVKGWEFSAGTGSNPAPMHGQSKTGLTGSHPDAPTYQRESAEADNSGGQSLKSGGSGSSGARPPTIANHPDRVATTQTDSRPTAAPALSAEQIAQWRQRMNDLQAIGVAMPPGSNVLADMALSSLTARDEGIEAVLNDEALHLSDRQRSRVRNLKGQP